MTIISLSIRAGIYPIIHVCLSIPAQFCCKIKLVSFWVHLRPSVFQDTITKYASGCIVALSNFPNPVFIGPV